MTEDRRHSETFSRNEWFARLFAGGQQELMRYILIFLPNYQDAQEVLQETSVALWRKIDQYEPTEPFLPWARGFARYEVLRHLRSRRSHEILSLSPDVIEKLATEWPERETVLDARRHALAKCLSKLPAKERELVDLRYESDRTVKQLADVSGRPADTLYKMLKRIRHKLLNCINRTLALSPHAGEGETELDV